MIRYAGITTNIYGETRGNVGGNACASGFGSVYKKRPTTFRTNTLKISTEELIRTLESEGFKFEKVSWYEDAFVLKSDSKKLLESELFSSGKIYVQSLSSMIPALVLQPEPGEEILDICAAPGSKTTQMAALMHRIQAKFWRMT